METKTGNEEDQIIASISHRCQASQLRPRSGTHCYPTTKTTTTTTTTTTTLLSTIVDEDAAASNTCTHAAGIVAHVRILGDVVLPLLSYPLPVIFPPVQLPLVWRANPKALYDRKRIGRLDYHSTIVIRRVVTAYRKMIRNVGHFESEFVETAILAISRQRLETSKHDAMLITSKLQRKVRNVIATDHQGKINRLFAVTIIRDANEQRPSLRTNTMHRSYATCSRKDKASTSLLGKAALLLKYCLRRETREPRTPKELRMHVSWISESQQNSFIQKTNTAPFRVCAVEQTVAPRLRNWNALTTSATESRRTFLIFL